MGGIPDRLSGLLSQVSWPAGHSRRDQSADPVAALPVQGAEQPGRQLRTTHPVPSPLSPAFAGAEIALPPVAVWGRVGRSCGTGKEAGLFLSEGNHCSPSRWPHRALQSSALRAAFALSFSSSPPPALLPSPPPYTLLAGAQLRGVGASPEVPGAPFGPIRLVQNDNDTHERASVPGIRPSATAAAGFAKDAGFI